MNLAEKKRYLQSYYNLIKDIAELDMKISELREDIQSTKQVLNDGMPRGNRVADLSDHIARLDELEIELIGLRVKKHALYINIHKSIDAMADETQKKVLHLRYLRRNSWDRICREMNYSWKQIHRIHNRALISFKIFEDDTQ